MKLRNKKTGEIVDLAKRGFLKSDNDNHIVVYPEGTLKYYNYFSLADLIDEWEDYKPAEPLIKDEKIRKAVRAWAEAWGFDRVYAYEDDHTNTTRFENGNEGVGIEIDNSEVATLRRNKCYTIAELCGEVEE